MLEKVAPILNESMGRRIAELRRRAKITQEQFAEEIGTDQPGVSKIETKGARCTLIPLAKLCRILNATPEELLA